MMVHHATVWMDWRLLVVLALLSKVKKQTFIFAVRSDPVDIRVVMVSFMHYIGHIRGEMRRCMIALR